MLISATHTHTHTHTFQNTNKNAKRDRMKETESFVPRNQRAWREEVWIIPQAEQSGNGSKRSGVHAQYGGNTHGSNKKQRKECKNAVQCSAGGAIDKASRQWAHCPKEDGRWAQWEPKFGDSANWVAALWNLVDNVLSFGRLAKPVSHRTPCLLIVP